MSNPLISVIVPVYKVEPYIDRCIRSIVGQSYTNLEIILVDDGSPDRCPEICDSWAEKDCRIKVIHKKNGGASSARNAGLDVFSGVYVAFVDSDDWIEVDYYATVINSMLRHNAQIGCVGRYDVDEATLVKGVGLCPRTERVLPSVQMLKQMLTWQECDFSACDKIFAASLWTDIRFPVGKTSEDIGALYKVVDRANKILMYPVPMYNYFHRKGSVTAENLATRNSNIVEFADEILAYAEQFHPDMLTEAKYFKLKTLLYWHRAFSMQPEATESNLSVWRDSRAWLFRQFMFVLFSCGYVKWKDKVWYILVLLKMKGLICQLARCRK